MVASASKRTGPSSAKWRPGDRVRFRFGLRDVKGTIVAEVGPIAKDGQMLYRIEFRMGGNDALTTELTANEFVHAG
jgi:hypothetical protein